MNVLITGGAGFIGSHLADRLLARGDRVRVIDNYATGRPDNLAPHPHLEVFEGTIADADLVERAFSGFYPELVVHAAAAYKDPHAFVEDVLTNVLGTIQVVQAAERHGASRLVYFQTALCYGLHPLEQPITLSHAIRPEGSSYAYSKTAGEQYLDLSGIPHVTFRLANAYGPRNLSGPLPTFYQRLTTGKPCYVSDTRRDFIFIDDLVETVLACIDRPHVTGAYHISSGRDFAIKELFDATMAALGIELAAPVEVRPRNPDDVYTILLDPSKTHEAFGGDHVKTPLETGVARAIAWYRDHDVNATYTHLKLEATPK
ncbi:MAG: NAD-dependent epimerase/dehydratase family protein [Candidatus Sericytochromatia bacterium]|nr:NAD-dependent epimerase/dehydratase family protein [Candidatus Tanganyikabacteria bacterium]